MQGIKFDLSVYGCVSDYYSINFKSISDVFIYEIYATFHSLAHSLRLLTAQITFPPYTIKWYITSHGFACHFNFSIRYIFLYQNHPPEIATQSTFMECNMFNDAAIFKWVFILFLDVTHTKNTFKKQMFLYAYRIAVAFIQCVTVTM